MKLIAATVGALAATAYAGKTCPNAGENMAPAEFVNPANGSKLCKAVKGNRTCQVKPTCGEGEKWRSLVNAEGGCDARACVVWPPACPTGENHQVIEFENKGGVACKPKRGQQYRECAPTLWGPNSTKDGPKCPDGERPKSMVQADGSCGTRACAVWPVVCDAGEEFRPLTYEPKTNKRGDTKQYCGVVKGKGMKVKGCRPIVTCTADQKVRSVYNEVDGSCSDRQCVDKNVSTNTGTTCGANERLGPVNCVANNDTYCKCDKDGDKGCVPKCGSTKRLKSLWDASSSTCESPVCVDK